MACFESYTSQKCRVQYLFVYTPPHFAFVLAVSWCQGWGRLQKPDYDYDYRAHKIIGYDYDYSGDWKGDYDYNYNHTITITVTCLPWKRS